MEVSKEVHQASQASVVNSKPASEDNQDLADSQVLEVNSKQDSVPSQALVDNQGSVLSPASVVNQALEPNQASEVSQALVPSQALVDNQGSEPSPALEVNQVLVPNQDSEVNPDSEDRLDSVPKAVLVEVLLTRTETGKVTTSSRGTTSQNNGSDKTGSKSST